jgi:hypothetical protein
VTGALERHGDALGIDDEGPQETELVDACPEHGDLPLAVLAKLPRRRTQHTRRDILDVQAQVVMEEVGRRRRGSRRFSSGGLLDSSGGAGPGADRGRNGIRHDQLRRTRNRSGRRATPMVAVVPLMLLLRRSDFCCCFSDEDGVHWCTDLVAHVG